MYSKYSETSEKTLQHFKTLSFFIACDECRSKFRKKLKEPLPEGKHELFKWIWKFKNEVNKRQREQCEPKKDISLKQAEENQYAMSDLTVMSLFFQKLIPSMPAFPRHHDFRGRNRYKLYRVIEELRKLVQDIWDIPDMSVLLTSIHRQL